MKVAAELYPTRFGNNNITEAFQKKEVGVRVEFETVDAHRSVIVLSLEETDELQRKLVQALEGAAEFLSTR